MQLHDWPTIVVPKINWFPCRTCDDWFHRSGDPELMAALWAGDDERGIPALDECIDCMAAAIRDAQGAPQLHAYLGRMSEGGAR